MSVASTGVSEDLGDRVRNHTTYATLLLYRQSVAKSPQICPALDLHQSSFDVATCAGRPCTILTLLPYTCTARNLT